jgi:pyridoxine 4-dehydrogenase
MYILSARSSHRAPPKLCGAQLRAPAANARNRPLVTKGSFGCLGRYSSGAVAASPDATHVSHGLAPGGSIVTDGMRLSIGAQLDVLRLGFGAMRITGPGIWGEPPDRAEAIRTLRRAVEVGVDIIDTADSYGPCVSEDLIAEALHPYPGNLVITTKGGMVRTGPHQWAPLGRPEYLRQCVEMSLRRLRVDCIDLYQFHRPDRQVPILDSLGALREMQEAGKIRLIGLSNVTAEQLAEARTVIDPVSVQNRYNITDRIQEPVLEICQRDGIAFIPWAPIAGGRMARAGGPLDTLAAACDATIGQLCLAWLLYRSPVMLPIPGTSKVAHLEENMAAGKLSLSGETWAKLEEDAQAHLAAVD